MLSPRVVFRLGACALIALAGIPAARSGQPDADGGEPARARGPAPRGKIVRVERQRAATGAALRVCHLPLIDEGRAVCYGGVPSVGDTAALFDEHGSLGSIRVTKASPSGPDPCSMRSVFAFEWIDRPRRRTQLPYAMGIFGLEESGPRARLVSDLTGVSSPSGRDAERPWLALDRDGDHAADLVSTMFECTDLAPALAGGAKVAEVHCIDYWLRQGSRWERARREYVYSCQ